MTWTLQIVGHTIKGVIFRSTASTINLFLSHCWYAKLVSVTNTIVAFPIETAVDILWLSSDLHPVVYILNWSPRRTWINGDFLDLSKLQHFISGSQSIMPSHETFLIEVIPIMISTLDASRLVHKHSSAGSCLRVRQTIRAVVVSDGDSCINVNQWNKLKSQSHVCWILCGNLKVQFRNPMLLVAPDLFLLTLFCREKMVDSYSMETFLHAKKGNIWL